MRKTLLATAAVFVVILVVAGLAAAAKPSSSLNVVVVGSDGNAAAIQPTFGSTITFDVQTNQTDHPNVNVRCYQGTAFVYDGWASFWPGAATGQNFVLSSNYWTSGAADCTARLVAFDKQGREQTLATTGFHVGA